MKTPRPGCLVLLLLTSAARADFLETFDGSPAVPAPAAQVDQPRWDIAVHSRNSDTWQTLMPANAHHGPNCDPPLDAAGKLVTHPFDGTYEKAVFQCKDHIMTVINGTGRSVHDGYALIALTPNHMVDFTNGEAVIRFDMTTFRSTQRDWVDLWVTPWDDNLQLPFDTGNVDLQGVPRNAVQMRMIPPNNNSKTGFAPAVFKNFANTGEFPAFSGAFNWWTGYEDFLQTSPQRRDTFELRISRTHIKFGMPSYNFWWVDKDINALDWTRGIVQLVHHSYTPDKDCQFHPDLMCGPDTWHWDSVAIAPSVPFTMIKADRRFVDSETTPVIFDAPAPANARLRFSAVGAVSVSLNDGPWTAVARQPSSFIAEGHTSQEHFSNYWVAVPSGTQRVKFRFAGEGGWYAGPYGAKDFALWSLDTALPPAKTGDLDGDGDVDVADLSILLGGWAQYRAQSDVDKDGDVDITDLSKLLQNWG